MSTYSSNLRIELITNGTQAGTWGDTTNSNLAHILDTSVAGYQTVSVIAASQALTYNNGPTSTAASNQAVYAMLRFTTTTGAAFAVYAPPASKAYIVWNDSGQSMTIYNSTVIGNTTAAGTGVAVANGNKVLVWSDATNFYEIKSGNVTGIVPVLNGGTGQTTANAALNALLPSQTNNRVLRSDGTNTSFAQVALATDISGTLPVANGGTGLTAGTSGGIPYYSSTSAITSSALLTQYGVVYGGGAGASPVATANGTTGQAFVATTGGAPSWGITGPAGGGTGVANNAAATVTSSGNFAYTRTLTGTTNVTLPTTGTLATLAGTETFTNKTLTTPNINSAQIATVSGTSPLYMARAWINFNGTGTPAIRASGNVTSITDNGIGSYTLNITTSFSALADAALSGSGVRYLATDSRAGSVYANMTSSSTVRVLTGYEDSFTGNIATDLEVTSVEVFR